jgi:hypothetical protein
MRDFRDAKAMAHALRDALKAKSIETSHSECLELIAKAFGYENWNILSAKIEAATPPKTGADASSQSGRKGAPPEKVTLYCSFCGKSQHEVRALIAGPTVFICDECVGLCDDIIDHKDDQEILSVLKADIENGNQAYPNAFEHLNRMPTDVVASFVARCQKAEERCRLALRYIQQGLAKRRGDSPETEGLLASPRFTKLESETEENLRNRLAEAERGLKQYEDAIRIGLTVLSARGHPS